MGKGGDDVGRGGGSCMWLKRWRKSTKYNEVINLK